MQREHIKSNEHFPKWSFLRNPVRKIIICITHGLEEPFKTLFLSNLLPLWTRTQPVSNTYWGGFSNWCFELAFLFAGSFSKKFDWRVSIWKSLWIILKWYYFECYGEQMGLFQVVRESVIGGLSRVRVTAKDNKWAYFFLWIRMKKIAGKFVVFPLSKSLIV